MAALKITLIIVLIAQAPLVIFVIYMYIKIRHLL